MTRKFIILFDTPINKRDFIRHGAEIFSRNKIDFSFWDLGQIINENYSSYKLKDDVESNNLIVFDTKDKVLTEFKKLNKRTVFVIRFPISIKSYFLFNFLRKKNLIWTYNTPLIVPDPIHDTSLLEKFYKIIVKVFSSPPLVIKKLIIILIKSKLNPTFNIISGKNSDNTKLQSFKKVFSHQFDYDIYLSKKYKKNKTLDKYAIFLDEFVPFHPDNIGRDVDCTVENYFDDLNLFFKEIEKEFNLKVIIAGHPRSNYDKKNPFQNRQIINNKTDELIYSSSLVLTHASTANNFSVIFNKPIIFIKSSKYSDYYISTINAFAKELNCYPIDISRKYMLTEKLLNIDLKAYSNYFKNYIKHPESEEYNSWQILINFINKEF